MFVLCSAVVSAQRIVVDTTSTNKYLIKKELAPEATEDVQKEEVAPSFGDRAMSLGMGIINRLKARLNLEEVSENLKSKTEKLKKKPDHKESASSETKDKGGG